VTATVWLSAKHPATVAVWSIRANVAVKDARLPENDRPNPDTAYLDLSSDHTAHATSTQLSLSVSNENGAIRSRIAPFKAALLSRGHHARLVNSDHREGQHSLETYAIEWRTP